MRRKVGVRGRGREGEGRVSHEHQVGLTRPPHRHISGLHYDVRMARTSLDCRDLSAPL